MRAEVTAADSLETFDPFICATTIHAVAAASADALEDAFRFVRDQVTILPIRNEWAAPRPASPVVDVLAALVAGQRTMLSAPFEPDLWDGKRESAVRTLGAALSQAGMGDAMAALAAADAAAGIASSPAPLLAFLETLAAPTAAAMPAIPPVAEAASAPAPPSAPTTLRVEQAKIDELMNLVGELVVAKNALAWLARRAEGGELTARDLAREIKDRHALVNRIAEDLQAAVMAVRMLPVDHVFQRFPRLVRDIARRLGKQVDLVMSGGETEADKAVIEQLADPLIHMVRNSLDHGLEPPEDRLAAGKPEMGTLRLSAVAEQDAVVISIEDDGRGIDPARVRAKAVEKGLIEAERAALLSDQEAVQLVFAPGFSTAAAVSDLSGRGVGMDVVRSAVEKAGGRVHLASRPGHGTTVTLTLPLTMAVTRIMTVACGERLFGVPMSLVAETVRVPHDALHRFRDREAIVLRNSVVPVVRLARLLELPEEEAAGAAAAEEAILVLRVNGARIGVVVGAFRDVLEVIVKPMEGVLAGLPGLAGTTLLGDGRVLLVLDMAELIS
jgi:two-component system chemotaxis sensor kinase CheA